MSIRGKIIIAVFAGQLAVGLAIAGHTVFTKQAHQLVEFEAQSTEILESVGRLLEDDIYYDRVSEMSEALGNLKELKKELRHLWIYDAAGHLVATEETVVGNTIPYFQKPADDLHRRWISAPDRGITRGEASISLGLPIFLGKRRAGTIIGQFDTAEIRQQTIDAALATAQITTIAILIALFLAVWALSGIARNIERLKQIAGEIGAGNFHVRARVQSTDETGALGSAIDRMAERLETTTVSRESLDQILGAVPEILLVLDHDLNVLKTNAVAREKLGISLDRPEPPPVLLEILGTGREQGALRRVYKSLTAEPERIIPAAGDGEETPILVSIKLFGSEEGGSLQGVLVARDISEQKKAQRTIETQQVNLVNSSRLSELGQIAAGVAHEINNPLAIVHGGVRRVRVELRKDEPSGDKVESGLSIIESSSERIAKIVKSLRTFARDASEDPLEPVAIHEIVSEVQILCASRLKHDGIAVETLPPDEPVLVACRPSQIEQVLLNLLNNAADAIAGQDERWIKMKTIARGECVDVVVTDSGPGIPPEVRAKIMNPFFTTKAVGKGTGLGLSISKGIAQSHGGDLTIDEDCPNTRFVLTLRVATDAEGVA